MLRYEWLWMLTMTLFRMLDLRDTIFASNRTVPRIAIRAWLFRMFYKARDMPSYIDQYTSLFSKLERMGKDSAIPDSHKAPMLFACNDQTCAAESTAAGVRTKGASEVTWDCDATTLINEYNAKSVSSTSSRFESRRKRSVEVSRVHIEPRILTLMKPLVQTQTLLLPFVPLP